MKKLSIRSNKTTYLINPNDIIYCEAHENYSYIYLPKGDKYLAAYCLKKLDQVLQGNGFLRIHRKYLVNSMHITSFNLSRQNAVIILNGSVELPIAIRKITDVKNFLKTVTS